MSLAPELRDRPVPLAALLLLPNAQLPGPLDVAGMSQLCLPCAWARWYDSVAAMWASRSAAKGSMLTKLAVGFLKMEFVDLLRPRGRRCLLRELLRRSIAYPRQTDVV